MRIIVLSAQYPSSTNLYANMFVHVRVLGYMRAGEEVHVIRFFQQHQSYEFEGVPVLCVADLQALRSAITRLSPDAVAIHFFQGWMLKKLIAPSVLPFVIWIHAIEGMWWWRRLFNFEFSREFFEYVKFNTIQMVRLRRLFRFGASNPGRARLVFVSKWIKKVAETDTRSRVTSSEVIPNPIDTVRFPYVVKRVEHRLRVLLIRPFNSRKYANDIAVDAIKRFSRRPEFTHFQFSIYGQGKLFKPLTKQLSRFRNVSLNESFLTHDEIRLLHESHGVFLCPTRQDSQGVSMCEAMSSGLVAIASDSTAIPEFVSHEETGFLTKDSSEIADVLARLFYDPDMFLRISAAAARDIRSIGEADLVVQKELAVLRQAARDAPQLRSSAPDERT